MPIATITIGTIIGARIRPFTAVRPGKRPRASASAASVPSTVARIVVRMATWTLLAMADDHCRSVSIRSYHSSVKPCGGKLRILVSVKLIGTITRVGAIR